VDAVAAAVLPLEGGARVTAFGFSQGAATACRWATRGRTVVHRLVAWGGEVPPDLDLPGVAHRLQGRDVILAAGRDDGFITPKVLGAMSERLRAHQIEHRLFPFEGGHEIPETALRELTETI
jgi:predicted esterase